MVNGCEVSICWGLLNNVNICDVFKRCYVSLNNEIISERVVIGNIVIKVDRDLFCGFVIIVIKIIVC